MSPPNDDFLNLLRATFKLEAEEHMQAITSGLLELEKTPPADTQCEIVETVFRAAHSLKGAARAVDLSNIESICQSLEEIFSAWKRLESVPTPDALDMLHRKLNAISHALAASQTSADTSRAVVRSASPPKTQRTEQAPAQPAKILAENLQTNPLAPTLGKTVRINVDRLDAQLVKAEEMLTVKLNGAQRVQDLRELASFFSNWRREWLAIEQETRSLQQSRVHQTYLQTDRRSDLNLDRLVNFFDWNQGQLKSLEEKVTGFTRAALQDQHDVGKLVDDLLEDSKKLLLLPFATMSSSFPKLVRDICRDQGKEADFNIDGESNEIDKGILEEMKDPLIHLLRNSIDHGIETPQERLQLGKPSRGTITLSVSQVNGSKVQLLIADDGAGIDTSKVKASAIKRGLLSEEEAAQFSEAEAQDLIFRSDVSTSPIITELSGRGLGLAIVREKSEKLGGTVSVESRLGHGTTFRVVIPATKVTFRGLLIEVAGRLLVLPTAQIERATRARLDGIRTVEGCETLSIDGRAVALVRLADILELSEIAPTEHTLGGVPVIVLCRNEQRMALIVEQILHEQEFLVKPLRKPLSRVRNIAAATVLGSGQVAPILHVADLFKSARKVDTMARIRPAAAKQIDARSILVAEDSITSRMLIKSILEAAGYQVKTAVDGLDALTLLNTEKFDLLVSDVEMPRLNGFNLTERIRADKKLQELPVVLVTALESAEDRERGIDVGANAYLVKSNFDQSNLIDAVRRLI